MKRILTGIKPTGRLHLGNYFGAIKPMIDLQDDYEIFFLIADLHSLTSTSIQKSPKKFNEDIENLILDLVSLGLDPDKVKIYRQSTYRQITTLTWVFNCLISLPSLKRAHAFKDATTRENEINAGLLTYPVLMAADILIANTDVVPVGPDQKQHLEIARDVARLFNKTYGETFNEPEGKIFDRSVIGIDGKKMSKSYNNTIDLFSSESELKKSIMSIVTDSKGTDEKKDPNSCSVFQLHKLFGDVDTDELESRYKAGSIGYKESKELLLGKVLMYFKDAREKKESLLATNDCIDKINNPNTQINTLFDEKLRDVFERIGIN